MVEVAYLSQRVKLSIRETLEQLKASGVDSLPGGGAEIFADRVRHIICDHKIDGSQWLDSHHWGVPEEPAALGYFVGADLLRQGARALIDAIAH